MEPVVTSRINLTNEEIKRYSRQLILPEVGLAGQERLKAAKVLLIGGGGLGSPLTLYLSAAGIGTLGLVDFDVVDFSNLQRQVLHFSTDVGKPKLQSARDKIAAINPHVQFVAHETKLTSANALEIIKGYDLVVDGTDNFPTRYLVNDACVLLQKPNVYGSIYRFEGMASVFAPHLGGPCYRCWYPEPPPAGKVPSCAEAGVLGVICGIIGTIQATEAIKLILGQGATLMGRLLRFNALAMTCKEHRIPRDPGCPLCGAHPTINQLIDYDQFCNPGDNPMFFNQKTATSSDELTVEELKSMLDRKEDFLLVDVRNPDEFAICAIAGSRKLPLPELGQRMHELPTDKLIVLHCHYGGRSMRALTMLRSKGYPHLKNLTGGIAAWAERIDPSLPQY